MSNLPIYVYAYSVCAGAHGSQKKMPDLLEVRLSVAVSVHMGAGAGLGPFAGAVTAADPFL